MREITIYYSYGGNCRKYALANDKDAIELTIDYKFSNNIFIKTWQVNKIANGKTSFTSSLSKDINLNDYDIINIISPVWNEKLCLPIYNFINSNSSILNQKIVNITAIMRGNRNFVDKQISPILSNYNLTSLISSKIKY